MADRVSPEKRSWMMAQVKSKNTSPELAVRSILHRLGFRFRLHVRKLPGSPDIVMRKHNAAIFVNGCFWHSHNCKFFSVPKSNTNFWQKKIQRNLERDRLGISELLAVGWRVAIVWECALKGRKKLALEVFRKQIDAFVLGNRTKLTIRGRR